MEKPGHGTYPPYYQTYIDKVEEEDIITALEKGLENTVSLFSTVGNDKENYQYAEGKWTVKEVFGHIIDTERVFAYRAMRIARGDTTSLPGFEQDDYIANGNFKERTLPSLLDEYMHLRKSNITLFKSFSEEQFSRMGVANNKPIQASALVAIIAGHELHHMGILKERYFSEKPVAV